MQLSFILKHVAERSDKQCLGSAGFTHGNAMKTRAPAGAQPCSEQVAKHVVQGLKKLTTF